MRTQREQRLAGARTAVPGLCANDVFGDTTIPSKTWAEIVNRGGRSQDKRLFLVSIHYVRYSVDWVKLISIAVATQALRLAAPGRGRTAVPEPERHSHP